MTEVIKVYADGRIGLTKKMLERYKLKTGDYMIIEEMPDHIKLIPAKVQMRRSVRNEV
jgi:hypothetical protein